MSKKKNFVLDTNVILHDYKCLHNFEENDIYIPVVVLEELDKFKRGNDQLNFNAREFVRELDLMTDNALFLSGVSLGPGLGKLHILTGDAFCEKVAKSFPAKMPDNQVLSATMCVMQAHPKMQTILVTKDINLRMKARALGISVEDYINDKVVDIDLFKKTQDVYMVDGDLIDLLYSSSDGVDKDKFDFAAKLDPNDYFILKSERNSALARYHSFDEKIKKVAKDANYGILPKNTEQTFAFDLLNDPNVKLIGITGKAGTGKTLIALASALKQIGLYRQILLARPIVALANKELGFLPGDEKQKIAPYMQPLFDNLNVIRGQFAHGGPDWKRIDEMQANNELVIEALAYIRGRSLSETFCIIDEAQNLTPHEIKTIITRAGEGTKMIFTGDLQQIDSPYLDAQSNGLAYMIDRMKSQDLFAHINLVKGERSRLSELASNLL